MGAALNAHFDFVTVMIFQSLASASLSNAGTHWAIFESPTSATVVLPSGLPNSQMFGSLDASFTWQRPAESSGTSSVARSGSGVIPSTVSTGAPLSPERDSSTAAPRLGPLGARAVGSARTTIVPASTPITVAIAPTASARRGERDSTAEYRNGFSIRR